jgi:steroid delta-isomerase-like uncharacterized protein
MKLRNIFPVCLFILVLLPIQIAMVAQSTGSHEKTKEVMTKYIDSNHSHPGMLADDVVFTNMATGESHTGREEVMNMLNYVYHIAFDARAEIRNLVIGDGKAVIEADFIGKHIGEFAGIPATDKEVRVPLCVVYDLENDKIKRARIYFEIPVLMEQLK